MRRLMLVLAGAALSLLAWQFSIAAQTGPTPQQRLQNSPLAAYPGFGHNPAADEARFDRESFARERLIARCMKQAGLPYTPVQSTRNDAAIPDQASQQDPNIAYAESLSAEQRKAYYLALYGVANPNSLAADDLYDRNAPGGGGCEGQAFATLPGVFRAQGVLNEEYLELRQSVKGEPRVLAAERDWSACMKTRGYQYATTLDLLAELDNAVMQGRFTPELEQRHQVASTVGRTCGTAVGLDEMIAQVRVEKESAFVAAHKVLLDQHLERIRNEDALIDQILNQGN